MDEEKLSKLYSRTELDDRISSLILKVYFFTLFVIILYKYFLL